MSSSFKVNTSFQPRRATRGSRKDAAQEGATVSPLRSLPIDTNRKPPAKRPNSSATKASPLGQTSSSIDDVDDSSSQHKDSRSQSIDEPELNNTSPPTQLQPERARRSNAPSMSRSASPPPFNTQITQPKRGRPASSQASKAPAARKLATAKSRKVAATAAATRPRRGAASTSEVVIAPEEPPMSSLPGSFPNADPTPYTGSSIDHTSTPAPSTSVTKRRRESPTDRSVDSQLGDDDNTAPQSAKRPRLTQSTPILRPASYASGTYFGQSPLERSVSSSSATTPTPPTLGSIANNVVRHETTPSIVQPTLSSRVLFSPSPTPSAVPTVGSNNNNVVRDDTPSSNEDEDISSPEDNSTPAPTGLFSYARSFFSRTPSAAAKRVVSGQATNASTTPVAATPVPQQTLPVPSITLTPPPVTLPEQTVTSDPVILPQKTLTSDPVTLPPLTLEQQFLSSMATRTTVAEDFGFPAMTPRPYPLIHGRPQLPLSSRPFRSMPISSRRPTPLQKPLPSRTPTREKELFELSDDEEGDDDENEFFHKKDVVELTRDQIRDSKKRIQTVNSSYTKSKENLPAPKPSGVKAASPRSNQKKIRGTGPASRPASSQKAIITKKRVSEKAASVRTSHQNTIIPNNINTEGASATPSQSMQQFHNNALIIPASALGGRIVLTDPKIIASVRAAVLWATSNPERELPNPGQMTDYLNQFGESPGVEALCTDDPFRSSKTIDSPSRVSTNPRQAAISRAATPVRRRDVNEPNDESHIVVIPPPHSKDDLMMSGGIGDETGSGEVGEQFFTLRISPKASQGTHTPTSSAAGGFFFGVKNFITSPMKLFGRASPSADVTTGVTSNIPSPRTSSPLKKKGHRKKSNLKKSKSLSRERNTFDGDIHHRERNAKRVAFNARADYVLLFQDEPALFASAKTGQKRPLEQAPWKDPMFGRFEDGGFGFAEMPDFESMPDEWFDDSLDAETRIGDSHIDESQAIDSATHRPPTPYKQRAATTGYHGTLFQQPPAIQSNINRGLSPMAGLASRDYTSTTVDSPDHSSALEGGVAPTFIPFLTTLPEGNLFGLSHCLWPSPPDKTSAGSPTGARNGTSKRKEEFNGTYSFPSDSDDSDLFDESSVDYGSPPQPLQGKNDGTTSPLQAADRDSGVDEPSSSGSPQKSSSALTEKTCDQSAPPKSRTLPAPYNKYVPEKSSLLRNCSIMSPIQTVADANTGADENASFDAADNAAGLDNNDTSMHDYSQDLDYYQQQAAAQDTPQSGNRGPTTLRGSPLKTPAQTVPFGTPDASALASYLAKPLPGLEPEGYEDSGHLLSEEAVEAADRLFDIHRAKYDKFVAENFGSN